MNNQIFEATLIQGDVFKKIINAIGDLVQDANFECSNEGIRLQAMDSSHVSLVSLFLNKDAFSTYNCNSSLYLGINFVSLQKVLKCSKSNDILTLQHKNGSDEMTIIFSDEDNGRTLRFDLKLMDIDSERLVIPDTNYSLSMNISSKEFKSITTELHNIGESITISGTKEGCKFGITGDIGNGDITLKNIINNKNNNNNEMSQDNEDMTDVMKGKAVNLICQDPITQSFALRYLVLFTKATSLSTLVNLYMSVDIPLVVEYKIDDLGHLKYYLAPKINEDE